FHSSDSRPAAVASVAGTYSSPTIFRLAGWLQRRRVFGRRRVQVWTEPRSSLGVAGVTMVFGGLLVSAGPTVGPLVAAVGSFCQIDLRSGIFGHFRAFWHILRRTIFCGIGEGLRRVRRWAGFPSLVRGGSRRPRPRVRRRRHHRFPPRRLRRDRSARRGIVFSSR